MHEGIKAAESENRISAARRYAFVALLLSQLDSAGSLQVVDKDGKIIGALTPLDLRSNAPPRSVQTAAASDLLGTTRNILLRNDEAPTAKSNDHFSSRVSPGEDRFDELLGARSSERSSTPAICLNYNSTT